MRPRRTARRLSAVVFLDIVGYSRIVHGDEVLGAQLLDRQRAVTRRIVPRHGGREVETAGDSTLLEFRSALAALQAVIAIQQALAADSPPRVVLRASIHLGDVERRGREVFGDGVNISARLLPLSPEGGVALSATVLGVVGPRLAGAARSIGIQTLKNIDTGVEVFVLDAAALVAMPAQVEPVPPAHQPPKRRPALLLIMAAAVTAAGALGAWLARDARPVVADTSVAVLPFTNLSHDPANAYFVDGVQVEILTALGRDNRLKVISRLSVEPYRDTHRDLAEIGGTLGVATVLVGAVQRTDSRARINVQLMDARNNVQIWAETYDRDVADVFAVQSEVAQQVTQSLTSTLLRSGPVPKAAAPTRNEKAYDLYLQAGYFARQVWDQVSATPVHLPKAIDLYERAVAEDPDFALAQAALARAHMYMYFLAPDRTSARLERARTAAGKALAREPRLGEGRFALALYHYWGLHDYATALRELELARQALPNDADITGFTAVVARRQGRWDSALEGFKQATLLDPQNANWWSALAFTHAMRREYAAADAAYGRAVAVALDPTAQEVTRSVARVYWDGTLDPLRRALDGVAAISDFVRANPLIAYSFHRWSRDDTAAIAVLATTDDEWLVYNGSNVTVCKSFLLGRLYAARGQAGDARRSYLNAERVLMRAMAERPDDADLLIGLALVHAASGRHEAAVTSGRHATTVAPQAQDALSGPARLLMLAEIYVAVGEHDKAVQLLQQLLDEPTGLIVSPSVLRLDPIWDPLRGHAGFQALLQRAA